MQNAISAVKASSAINLLSKKLGLTFCLSLKSSYSVAVSASICVCVRAIPPPPI